MNPNGLKTLQLNLSGLGCWLTVIGVVWLLGAIGLGWLVKSALVLLLLLFLAPVLLFLGFRWWLQRNLVQGNCPVCRYELTGINGIQSPCPSCGTVLTVKDGQFIRPTPTGTVDVDAVEVSSVDVLEESVPDNSSESQG